MPELDSPSPLEVAERRSHNRLLVVCLVAQYGALFLASLLMAHHSARDLMAGPMALPVLFWAWVVALAIIPLARRYRTEGTASERLCAIVIKLSMPFAIPVLSLLAAWILSTPLRMLVNA